jgi:hypothetical protein
MMKTTLVTAQEADDLLTAAAIRDLIADYDPLDEEWALRQVPGLAAADVGHVYGETVARLLAAAPALARTVIAQDEQLRKLEAAGQTREAADHPTGVSGEGDPLRDLVAALAADPQFQAVEIMRASIGAQFDQMAEGQQAVFGRLIRQFAAALDAGGMLHATPVTGGDGGRR